MRRLGLIVIVLLAVPGPARAAPFCAKPIARAAWSDETQGSRIKVFPTGCGRRTAFLATRDAFRDALAAGGRAPVHRRSLYLQFRCHAYFAPFKRSWNLEAWRPVVSPRRLVKALCNPAGQVKGSFAGTERKPKARAERGLIAQIVATVRRLS